MVVCRGVGLPCLGTCLHRIAAARASVLHMGVPLVAVSALSRHCRPSHPLLAWLLHLYCASMRARTCRHTAVPGSLFLQHALVGLG
jgi:hypothetical protein